MKNELREGPRRFLHSPLNANKVANKPEVGMMFF